MEERGAKFSLLVTGIFLLVLLVLAAIFRPNTDTSRTDRNLTSSGTTPPPVARTVGETEMVTAPSTQTMLPPPKRGTAAVPKARVVEDVAPEMPKEKTRQQILTNCKLKPDISNDGDSFSVLTRSGEYRFSLYFIDAPDINFGTLQDMKNHSAYFGDLSEENLRTVSRDAQQYVAKVLQNRKFDVVTRWERAPEESPNREVTCRAFICFRDDEGRVVNLASLLVEQGLATICATNESLPDGTDADRYITKLQKVEELAYNQHRGAWYFQSAVGSVTPVRYRTR